MSAVEGSTKEEADLIFYPSAFAARISAALLSRLRRNWKEVVLSAQKKQPKLLLGIEPVFYFNVRAYE